ncbi:helix-turn-helix transcriptional regulator [Sphingomonas sp. M1-B02]|uniref:helix-turn-helix transcriptional regulator n=1 Tax=Sphingomonas sp. M1-B02 TaxID=3114300 RepID=UPI0022407E7E|nr:LuxR C-terminal-related transcriptional regulator [Sphingomonas sp. S6-11]UZK65071.1 LuxR C-terminal-related transcriptional regulator [Sphingomonas sp. S6-11]
MSYIRKIEEWRAPVSMGAIYERLLQTTGTEQFGPAIHDAVMTVTGGARRIYLFEATGRENSDLQYFFCEPRLEAMLPAYSQHYHNIDPVCDAYSAAPCVSDIAIQRIRPEDIGSDEFRRRFFDQAGIVERVSIIQRGAHAWRVINVARHRSTGIFSDGELDALLGLARLALPMLPLNRRRALARSPSAQHVEDRLHLLCPSLTRREQEVCARATVGMSVEATAIDLGIAKTSVMTYRKRSYQRLGITSVHELCALLAH